MWISVPAFGELHEKSTSPPAKPVTDQYGGLVSVRAPATGYFYLHQTEQRWFFITPEGHGYLPIGINHLKSYFSGENVAGSESEPNLANVLHGGDKDLAVQHLVSQLQTWGFNYAGYDAPREFHQLLPFSVGFYPVRASAVIRKDFAFEDVFAPAFVRDLNRRVEQLTRPYRQNRWLLGYYLADLPLWGTRADLDRDERQYGASWISFFRNLPANSPGHQAYLQFLRQRYAGRFAEFASIYPTTATSFEELQSIQVSQIVAEKAAADDEAFQGVIANQLYTLTCAAFRQHDPNHLVLGERFVGSRVLFEPVLNVARQHFPIVAVQQAGPFQREFYQRLHEKTGRPILSVDHVLSFPTATIQATRGYQVESELAAAFLYRNYLTTAFTQPWFVGYNRCQLVDRVRIPSNPPIYKQGLLKNDGQPYNTLLEQVN